MNLKARIDRLERIENMPDKPGEGTCPGCNQVIWGGEHKDEWNQYLPHMTIDELEFLEEIVKACAGPECPECGGSQMDFKKLTDFQLEKHQAMIKAIIVRTHGEAALPDWMRT